MLNQLAKEIHENAVAHGWWEEERSFGEIVALCHSELSEALEEYRANRPMLYCDAGMCMRPECRKNGCKNVDCFTGNTKPEGIAVEMADVIIRILDWCGKEGIDMDAILRIKTEYNKTRSYRHGGKKL